jgi:raffinose/stachyose/melibiose transport system permease protein
MTKVDSSALARPPRAGKRWRAGIPGFFMGAPAVILFSVMMLVPLALSVYLSFTDWNGYSPNPNRVGTANYVRLFKDPDVISAGWVTAIIVVVGTIGCNVLGLGYAVLIAKPTRSNRFFRMVFFYPHVISALIIGFLWSAILSSGGAINSVLEAAGHSGLPFLAQPRWALICLIFVVLWSTFGVSLVLYVAGLQTIPESLIEAARIDGAGPWTLFRRITLPMLAPIVTVNVTLILVSLIRMYDLVLSLTGGGPAGKTQTVAYLVLGKSFQRDELGYGSAQSVVLIVVTAVIAICFTILRRRSDMAIQS